MQAPLPCYLLLVYMLCSSVAAPATLTTPGMGGLLSETRGPAVTRLHSSTELHASTVTQYSLPGKRSRGLFIAEEHKEMVTLRQERENQRRERERERERERQKEKGSLERVMSIFKQHPLLFSVICLNQQEKQMERTEIYAYKPSLNHPITQDKSILFCII